MVMSGWIGLGKGRSACEQPISQARKSLGSLESHCGSDVRATDIDNALVAHEPAESVVPT